MLLSFSFVNVIESSHSCIVRIHATIITSSSFINTIVGPIILDLIFPFKWLEREVNVEF